MLLGVATLLVVGGCGGDEEEPTSTSSAAETTASEEEVTTTEEESTDTTEEEPPEEPEELASRRANISGSAIELSIVELARSGETTDLTISLSFADEEDSSSGAQIAGTFDDGNSQEVERDPGAGARSLDGITLLDGVNKQLYLVARDESGQCVCDVNLSQTFIDPGAPTVLSATFGAPPEDVESIDVMIPNFGTFRDVPIS